MSIASLSLVQNPYVYGLISTVILAYNVNSASASFTQGSASLTFSVNNQKWYSNLAIPSTVYSTQIQYKDDVDVEQLSWSLGCSLISTQVSYSSVTVLNSSEVGSYVSNTFLIPSSFPSYQNALQLNLSSLIFTS